MYSQPPEIFSKATRLGVYFNKFLCTPQSEFLGFLKNNFKQIPLDSIVNDGREMSIFVLSRNIWGNKEILMHRLHDSNEEEYCSLAFSAQSNKYLMELEKSIKYRGSGFVNTSYLLMNDTVVYEYQNLVYYGEARFNLQVIFQKLGYSKYMVILTLF